MGWCAYASSSGYRRKFNFQWQQAYSWSATQSLEGGWDKSAAIKHTGQMVLESLWVWCRPHSETLAMTTCPQTQEISNAVAEGKGVICLTPHMGAFEVSARYYSSSWPMTALFKPSKFDALNGLFEVARDLPGLTMAPADSSGVKKLLKALKNKQSIGLLPDQVPPAQQGDWAPFFGLPAYSMTLPYKLWRLTDAVMLIVFCERLPRSKGWVVHVRKFDGEPTPVAVNAAMQAWILEHPEQYLWGYNRYKTPVKNKAVAT